MRIFLLSILAFFSSPLLHAGEKKADGLPVFKECQAELANLSLDAKVKNDLALAFSPPNPGTLIETIQQLFPGLLTAVETQGKQQWKLTGTKVTVHMEIDDPVRKVECAKTGVSGLYLSDVQNPKLILCSAPSQADLLDIFRHEATHALQFNGGSQEQRDKLLSFISPINNVSSLAKEYSMSPKAAANYESTNGEHNRASAEATFNASEELIKRLLNPIQGGHGSSFGLLSTLGNIRISQMDPLSLQWSANFDRHGGEEKFKNQLHQRTLSAEKGCKNQESTPMQLKAPDPLCPFVSWLKENSYCHEKKSYNAENIWGCLKQFARTELAQIERVAAISDTNKKSIYDFVKATYQNACFPISSFCTESQAHMAAHLAKAVRTINAQKSGLSEKCQIVAWSPGLDPNSSIAKETLARVQKDILGPYNQSGWQGLQNSTRNNVRKTIDSPEVYGGLYSALNGFRDLTPKVCQKTLTPAQCRAYPREESSIKQNVEPAAPKSEQGI